MEARQSRRRPSSDSRRQKEKSPGNGACHRLRDEKKASDRQGGQGDVREVPPPVRRLDDGVRGRQVALQEPGGLRGACSRGGAIREGNKMKKFRVIDPKDGSNVLGGDVGAENAHLQNLAPLPGRTHPSNLKVDEFTECNWIIGATHPPGRWKPAKTFIVLRTE